jgi:hypothetical protein
MAETLSVNFDIQRKQLAAFVKDPKTVRDMEALFRLLSSDLVTLLIDKVDETRAINTIAGQLTGGGDLSADLSLGLADTAVVAGIYGDSTNYAVYTVDEFGRLTHAGELPLPTASGLLDAISSTQGSIIYRGASGWVALAPGTAGKVLQTNGSGADPSWATVSGGSGGSVSIVQYATFVGDNPTLTLGATPTAGNLLVAVAGVWNGVTGSNSPWVTVVNVAGSVNDGVYAAYRAVTAADTSATISKPAIQTTSQGWNITIFEIAGAAFTPPIYDFFKEQSATSKDLNVASSKTGSAVVGCFNTNSGNPSPSSITGATAGTSVAGTSTGGSPRRANPFSSTGLSGGTGLTVTVNYASAPTAITGLALVFAPA